MTRDELANEIEKIFKKHGGEIKKGNRKGYFCYTGNIHSNRLSTYVIHIPHSKLEAPKEFYNRLNININDYIKESIFEADYLVDNFVPNNYKYIVKFKYSRMFCDVERYLDDEKEEMSKLGMGCIYEKDSNGINFINIDKDYKNNVINTYYKKHHEELDNMVGDILSKNNKCFIIDLHSFSDEFVYKLFKLKNTPDICIGYNKDNCDKKLLEKTISHFEKYGYKVKTNYPYSGSLISNKYPKVPSIMIEINKRVYLNDIDQYNKFYNCMMEYYKIL